jgi:hypothetical protein
MSYLGSCADAVATIHAIEESENTHSSQGSKILAGHDTPGGAAMGHKPSTETLMPGRLRAGIKKPMTRTDTLQRKYAATGHNEPSAR